MFNIDKYGNFKPKKREENKTQIVLFNSSREVKEYLTSLTIRYNGRYDKIPHFVVGEDGNIYNLLPENSVTNIFDNDKTNDGKVFICLENFGWLVNKPFSDKYINWKGDIYSSNVFTKKWRGYNFWGVYNKNQIEKTALLCNMIMDKFNIDKNFTGHNTKIEGVDQFEGVVSRSNYTEIFTDINPSFDFKLFFKKIKN